MKYVLEGVIPIYRDTVIRVLQEMEELQVTIDENNKNQMSVVFDCEEQDEKKVIAIVKGALKNSELAMHKFRIYPKDRPGYF